MALLGVLTIVVVHGDGTTGVLTIVVVHGDGTPRVLTIVVVHGDGTPRVLTIVVVHDDGTPRVLTIVVVHGDRALAMGDLPVTLYPQEQHSVLLRLDESFLSYGVPQWGGGSGTECSRGSVGPSGGGKAVLPLCLKWHVAGSKGPAVWSQFGAECQLPLRSPLQVTVTCLSDGCEGGLLTAVLCIANHGSAEVDLLALLPRDLHYHLQPHSAASTAGTSGRKHAAARSGHETPALIPLNSKKDLGRIIPGGSHSVYLQFLATRSGLHPLPPVLLVDRRTNRKVLARGGQVLVTQALLLRGYSVEPLFVPDENADSLSARRTSRVSAP
ncbi:trapp trafficking subunit trs65 [Cyclospora cayetanensis]|uniref:Trapp trafficking subunit trs65 n=1 Tax=Cyclospora cayetanensis TaxID=88456 RepID=A0A1D3D992_9EIME|nr:trapp trafficking subunit trs65 [Cyclospora cayetanensis]